MSFIFKSFPIIIKTYYKSNVGSISIKYETYYKSNDGFISIKYWTFEVSLLRMFLINKRSFKGRIKGYLKD